MKRNKWKTKLFRLIKKWVKITEKFIIGWINVIEKDNIINYKSAFDLVLIWIGIN